MLRKCLGVDGWKSFLVGVAIIGLPTALIESSRAQVIESSIQGVVTDPSGAVIPDVKIEVSNTATGDVRQAQTNAEGSYTVPSLTRGTYALNASAQGFQTQVVIDIGLEMDQKARIDLTMQIGQVTDTVTVESTAIMLNTERPEVAQLVEEKLITELPLNGRNFLQLASISTGVVNSFGRGSTEADNFAGGRKDTTMHVGARGDALSFLVDGVDVRMNTRGFTSLPLAIDSIAEFKVQKNMFSSEYGYGAAIVSAMTKSGTNEFHGTVFGFIRNDNLDARNFFEAGKNEFRQNQFGASAGGPIVKDKTFFFGNYEGLRIRQEQTFIAAVPTEAQKNGDYTASAEPVIDPFSGNPFPNNVIPRDRISNWANEMNKFIPSPNLGATGLNLNTTDQFVRDFDQFTVKIDHRFSDTDVVSGRYIQHDDKQLNPRSHVKNTRFASPIEAKNIAFQYTRIFSPTLLNSFKFGYNRGFADTVNEECQPACDKFGLRNLGLPEGRTWLPSTGILGFNGWGGIGFGFGETEETFQFSDTLSIIRGKHSMSTGFDVRHITADISTFESTSGRLFFEGTFTGHPMADYVLGIPREFNSTVGTNVAKFSFPGYAFFFQDDIKLHPRLTLNLGVRYEWRPPVDEERNHEQRFDWQTGILRIGRPFSDFPGVDIPEPPWIQSGAEVPVDFADKNNVAPRIGLAWRPLGEKTVIRTGFGLFYIVQQFLEEKERLVQEPPVRLPVSIASDPDTPELLIDRGDLIPPSANVLSTAKLALQAVGVPVDRTPFMMQWNFGIQHQIKGYLFDATYAGSGGRKLGVRMNMNSAPPSTLPDPQSRKLYQDFTFLLARFHNGTSSYNSLQLKVEKRFSEGLGFLLSHTYSHALDIESREPSATVVQDPRNLKLNKGNSAYDVRHRFVGSLIYELPFGTGKAVGASTSGFANKMISGWQVNSLVTLSEGNWFSPRVRQDRANEGPGFRWQRPDVLRDPNIPGGGTVEEWFDTSAMVLASFGQYGNMGRNTLRSPGITLWDFSLFKNTYIGERFNVQFRTEFFNFLNRPNFRTPNISVDRGGFGAITAAEEPRRIQFGLKLIW